MKAFRDADSNIIFKYSADVISELELPCGQCIGCRLNHAEGWAVRMVHEAQNHAENSFITLTYNDDHLPNGLQYQDVTKFIKRLRKILSKTPYKGKIKYYRVGEYGDKLNRPHYHIVLFGFDFSYPLRYKGVTNEKIHWRSNGDRKYYISTFLNDLWGKGHAELGAVDYSTCMYVAKYVTKKVTGKNQKEHYGDKEPEKASMSKKSPIGKNWLEQYYKDVYPRNGCVLDGRTFRVPKYYDTWLEKTHPDLYEQIKLDREQNSKYLNCTDKTRKYEHKIAVMRNNIREFDISAPISSLELKRLQYLKELKNYYHQQGKEK